jgi:hypothetical protein
MVMHQASNTKLQKAHSIWRLYVDLESADARESVLFFIQDRIDPRSELSGAKDSLCAALGLFEVLGRWDVFLGRQVLSNELVSLWHWELLRKQELTFKNRLTSPLKLVIIVLLLVGMKLPRDAELISHDLDS